MVKTKTRVRVICEPETTCRECGNEIDECDKCGMWFEDDNEIICVDNYDQDHLCLKCGKK